MNKTVTLVIQIIVGGAMVFLGANKIFHFTNPDNKVMGEQMDIVMDVLNAPFMYVVGALEFIAGLALLVRKFVPLALTILIAIMLNAFMLHIFYDPKNYLFSLLFLILCLVLVFAHKDRFKSLLSV